MELVAQWWNGRIGAPGAVPRRVVRLYTDGRTWRVERQQGHTDPQHEDYSNESDARARVAELIKAATTAAREGEDWRELPPL